MPHYKCTNCGAAVYKAASGRLPCPECGEWGYLTGSFEKCRAPHPGAEAACQLPEGHDGEHSARTRLQW